jgi:hypothetical protein
MSQVKSGDSFQTLPLIASYESVNYPGNFIRHQDYRGKITGIKSNTIDVPDATWNISGTNFVKTEEQNVSFNASNYPKNYLRHRNFEVWLDVIPTDSKDIDLYKQDSTFTIVPALWEQGRNKNAISFKSVNYPSRYLRHQNGLLFVHENDNSELFSKDASFYEHFNHKFD